MVCSGPEAKGPPIALIPSGGDLERMRVIGAAMGLCYKCPQWGRPDRIPSARPAGFTPPSLLTACPAKQPLALITVGLGPDLARNPRRRWRQWFRRLVVGWRITSLPFAEHPGAITALGRKRPIRCAFAGAPHEECRAVALVNPAWPSLIDQTEAAAPHHDDGVEVDLLPLSALRAHRCDTHLMVAHLPDGLHIAWPDSRDSVVAHDKNIGRTYGLGNA